MNEPKPSLPSEALAALEQGSKIEAIKHVRQAQGLGLKEAKDLIEAYIEAHPDLKTRIGQANAESAKGFFRWILLVGVLGWAAYQFLGGKN